MGSGCPRPSKLSSGHSLERTSVPVVALCRGFPWCLECCCTSNGNWHLGVSDVRALRWLLRQSVSDEYSRRCSTYLSRSKFSMLEARISQIFIIIICKFSHFVGCVSRRNTLDSKHTERVHRVVDGPDSESPALLGALCGRMQVPVTLEALHV